MRPRLKDEMMSILNNFFLRLNFFLRQLFSHIQSGEHVGVAKIRTRGTGHWLHVCCSKEAVAGPDYSLFNMTERSASSLVQTTRRWLRRTRDGKGTSQRRGTTTVSISTRTRSCLTTGRTLSALLSHSSASRITSSCAMRKRARS